MPEPAGSPSDPSPTSSQFFDEKAIIAELEQQKSNEEEIEAYLEGIDSNTYKLLDFVKDDISDALEKITSGAKISREDLVIKENERARVFGDIVSTTTSVNKSLTAVKQGTTKFFDFAQKGIIALGIGLGLAVLAIKTGLDKTVNQVSSGVATLVNIPRAIGRGTLLLSKVFAVVAGLAGGIVRLFPESLGKITKTLARLDKAGISIGKFVRSPLIKLSGFERFVFRIIGFFRGVGSAFSVVGKIGSFIGKILKFVSPLAKLLGKIFFPITLIISLIEGIADFVRGGEGGIGKLLLDIGDRLIENLTFGILDLRSIIDTLDALFTAVRIGFSYLTFGRSDDRDQLRADRSIRALENARTSFLNDLTRAGFGRDEANTIVNSSPASLSSDLRSRLATTGLSDELEDLRQRRIEAAKLNRDNAQLQGLIRDVATQVAATNANIERVNAGRASEGVKSDSGGGIAAPSRVVPSLGGR